METGLKSEECALRFPHRLPVFWVSTPPNAGITLEQWSCYFFSMLEPPAMFCLTGPFETIERDIHLLPAHEVVIYGIRVPWFIAFLAYSISHRPPRAAAVATWGRNTGLEELDFAGAETRRHP